MKKIYLLLCLFIASVSASFAQPIANAGMESWHSISVIPVIPLPPFPTVHAPTSWYGDDSIIRALGPALKPSGIFSSNLFQDTFRHSGSFSAKVMSLNQDTLGIVPGMVANTKPEFSLSGLGGGGSLTDFLTFTGGTPTTLRTRTVSAWVAYKGGLDTITSTMGGPDTGMMIVQAIAVVGGADSVIGMGFMPIFPSDTFVEVTATVMYFGDTTFTTDFARIIFASSGGASSILDSSTLWVDDVSMTGTHQEPPPPPPVDHTGVRNTKKANNVVAVYPNPANNTLFFEAKNNDMLRCRIMSADGRIVAIKSFSGSTSVDVSSIAAGSYFYFLTDDKNAVVQHGKVNVTH